MASHTVPTADGCALSAGQEALWFLYALAPGSSAYNISAAVALDVPVDAPALASAVLAVVSRDGMLNCLFRSARAGVRRLPGAAAPYASVFETRTIEGPDPAAGLEAAALEASRRPFRLDREAPVRVSLLSQDAGGGVIVVTAHHIALDNVSHLAFFRDVLTAYGRAVGGTGGPGGSDRADGTNGSDADYAAFVERERDFLRSPRGEAARRYWQGVLQAVPHDPPLVGDLPRPAVYRFAGDQTETVLPARLADGVAAVAAKAGATPFAVLFALFQLLLYGLTGERVRLVGFPASVRPGRGYTSAIGHYVNTLPFAARVEPDDSFPDLLRRTAAGLWSGLVHRAYPFALMPSLADRPREADRAGLLSVLFVMTDEDPAQLVRDVPPSLRGFRRYPLPEQQGQFDLTLQISRRGPVTGVVLKYNTLLFSAEAARAVADAYFGLLTAAAENTLPDRLGDLVSASAPHIRPCEGVDPL